MTPEQLKASILQYAIQGKLVEQRPEECNADLLFDKIKNEINQLVKDKKISKPKKMFPIEDIEQPFVIPNTWKWVRLGMVCNEILVPQRDKPKSFGGIIPWCRIEDIEGKYLNGTKSNQYVTHETISTMNLKVNPVGTVISANSASVGAAAICSVECVTNQTFIGLVCNKGLYNEFLYYFLKANVSTLKKMGSGTTIIYISQDKYWNLPFPLPPLEEQRRIVAKIEELLPFVDRYAEAYEKLEKLNAKFPEDMKKSILQYAIQGKLVEQRAEEGTAEELYQRIQDEKAKLVKEGKIKKEKNLDDITEDEIPFDIPEHWKWVRLGDIITFQGGYAFKSDSYISKSNNQVIRLGNVKTNKLLIYEKEVFISDELSEQVGDYKIQKNDILVSMTGTRRKKDYFFTVLIDDKDLAERKLYLNQRVGCFRAIEGICHKYLLYVLQTDVIKDIIFLKETGTANQGNLGSEDMKKYVYVPLPPYEEQKRIVEKIEELLPYCDMLIK